MADIVLVDRNLGDRLGIFRFDPLCQRVLYVFGTHLQIRGTHAVKNHVGVRRTRHTAQVMNREAAIDFLSHGVNAQAHARQLGIIGHDGIVVKRDNHAVFVPKRLFDVIERVMTFQRAGLGRHLGMRTCKLPARAVVVNHQIVNAQDAGIAHDLAADMFDELYNDDSQEREFTHKIYGYDNNPKANEIAQHNVKAAGVSKDVILKIQPFQQFEQPAQKSIIITNPPYGERISSEDLLGLYQMIGERLKHAFTGNDAWILSYRDECFDQIGLKASIKVPLFNGALECQFRKYQLFDGKYKEFRSDNSDKEFKPKREERPARPRRQGEKVEYGRKERKDGGRGERKEGFRSDRKEGFRKDADRKETFRGRKAGDGKEFTRERRKEFKYKEDSKPRTPRPSTDDGRPKAAPAPRYMHRRRSEEEGNSQD